MEIKKSYYERYVEPYKEFLGKFAKEVGLRDDNRRILLTEALSRYIGEECLFDIDLNWAGKNNEGFLVQMPVSSRYDIDWFSDTYGIQIPVEVKCRGCRSNDYPTTDITASKGDFVSGKTGCVLIFFLEDSKYYLFDLLEYTPKKSKWVHKATTAYDNGETVEEERYQFDLSKAKFSGRFKWKPADRKS